MKKYKTLKDHVYDYIAEQILEGNLLPSHRINETIISQELSISRTPVREALIQLSCEDILENLPRKGFVLKGMTEKEAAELYVVIGALDGIAAKLSCDILNERDISRMEFHIQSMDLAINTTNYEMYLEQQRAFHQVYLDRCDNEVLSATITRMKNKFFTRGLYNSGSDNEKELLRHINDEHREILEFFKQKDKEGVFNYLTSVHWSPSNAYHEIIEMND